MIEINLLPHELKEVVAEKKKFTALEPKNIILLISAVFAVLIFLNICFAAAAIAKSISLSALNRKWQSKEAERKTVEVFNKEYNLLSQDSAFVQQLLQGRVNWAQKLNKLSLSLPPGVWFNEINVTAKDFFLRGSAVSLAGDDMGLIKRLIDGLKSDSAFFKDFSNLELTSVQKRNIASFEISDFVLTGTLKAK